MTNYEPRTTQENQILDLLIGSRGTGVYSYQLAQPKPIGLGILQYNARIFGLRKKGHRIISDFRGHYIIKEEREPMTQEELDQKLEVLREDWRTAGVGMRKLIEARANLLKKRFAEQNEEEPVATPELWEAIQHEQKE